MTRETIMENIRRVAAFYGMPEDSVPDRDFIRSDVEEVQLLFTGYGRVLDYNGAPADGLSFVIVASDEYEECLTWAKENGKNIMYQNDGELVPKWSGISYTPKSFGFMDMHGYYWHVKIKEDKA